MYGLVEIRAKLKCILRGVQRQDNRVSETESQKTKVLRDGNL